MHEQLFERQSNNGENPFDISCNKLTVPILVGGGAEAGIKFVVNSRIRSLMWNDMYNILFL